MSKGKKKKKMIALQRKLHHKQCHDDKVQMRKIIETQEKKNSTQESNEKTPHGSVPACLLDRGTPPPKLKNFPIQLNKNEKRKWENEYEFSNMIKQNKRRKYLKVHAQGDTEVLKVIQTGKRKKRRQEKGSLLTKVSFV